jgi:hypothetical protein
MPWLALILMSLAITKPVPFDEAVRRLEAKTPVASRLSSSEWRDIALGLRERAFFSAKVDDVRVVAGMQARVQEALDLSSRDAGRAFMDRDKFIADMREQLGAAPGDSGNLQDITSSKRLGLVYDFNVEDAMEHGRWTIGQDEELRAAFPCQELVRVEDRIEPRPWQQIFADAGGKVVDGRMIAPKDDPVWMRISDFGRPWPPFKYGSGMGVEDCDAEESVQLGIIPEGYVPKEQSVDFNKELEASIAKIGDSGRASLREIFGDQINIEGDAAKWDGSLLSEFYDRAIAEAKNPAPIDLGAAAEEAELGGARVAMHAEDLQRVVQRNPEITADDMRMLPWLWRAPGSVRTFNQGLQAHVAREDFGRAWSAVLGRSAIDQPWRVSAFSWKTTNANWPHV